MPVRFYNFTLNWSAQNPGGILPVQRQRQRQGLWACANTNIPYKVGDGSIFILDFPLFVMNDDVHVLIK